MARRAPRTRRGIRAAAGGVAAVLVLAAALIWIISAGASRRDSGLGGPFSLVADDGRVVTDRSFPGKYLAIYFGYTSCKDVCPATLTTLGAVLGRLDNRARQIQPLFITVDPARDTASVLRRYVANFSPGLIGLTGSAVEIERVEREYGVLSVPHDGVVDHSSVILLFAPDGRLVAPIPADASEMVMMQALARYTKLQ